MEVFSEMWNVSAGIESPDDYWYWQDFLEIGVATTQAAEGDTTVG